MKKLLFIAILGLVFKSSFAQKWAEMMRDPNANLYQVQAEFNKYFKDKDVTEKGNGFKAFKRWENFVEPRVYPSGDLSQLSLTAKNYAEFLGANGSSNNTVKGGNNMIASTTWTAIGPFGAPAGAIGNRNGRINFITIHPAGTNTLFIGAPAGGLWKSTNAGASWTTNTDNLTVSGCSDLAISPSNPSIMYLATGDSEGDVNSFGVLKSIDGGNTWAATGLTAPLSNYFLIRRLIVHPTNDQIVIAATNAGIYRTINGGTNWTQVNTSNCYDVEFKPGTPTTVYAVGASFRLSTDGGATWVQITNGITNGASRMAVAVTPADPNYVYVNSSNGSGALLGVYRSTNSGVAFTLMANSPNIMGWNNPASGTTGQGWYDNCIAASPLNAQEVVIGGINVWRSTNGGTNFTCIGHWTGSGAPFTHADIHDVEYSTGGTLYNTNDGTVCRYTGAAWTEIGPGINVSQIYKMGLSALSANLLITGHQDNGTNTWNSGTYTARIGGDGMDCFIDRTNNSIMYGSLYYTDLRKSTNGGANWNPCITGLGGTAPWVTPWKQDPVTAATQYCGTSAIYRTTNQAVSWTSLAALPVTAGTVIEFAIAPSNNQVIYVLKTSGIFKTTNGGTSWTTVTGSVPVGSAAPTFITIDATDPNTAWVTLSGYIAGNKVFMTTNGGTAWTNVSSNLPNIPANCSVYQTGTNDRIYVGMDAGVYYKDNSSGTWTIYNIGLPNTPVRDMEISAAASTKIRAATYGRGVWEVDVLPANIPPASTYSVASSAKCVGLPIYLNDLSTNGPTGWSWTVTPMGGVTLNTATSQNPTLTCNNPGTYTISMIATNGAGSGPVTSQTILVSPNPTVTVSLANQTVCANSSVTLTAAGAAAYNWSSGGGSGTSAVYVVVALSTYTVTGTTLGCVGNAVATVATKTLPIISTSATNTNLCVGQTTTLNATGAGSYTWNPGNVVGSSMVNTPTVTTSYTCTGTDVNACLGSGVITIFVSACTGINQLVSNSGIFSVYPNPTSGKLTIQVPPGKVMLVNSELVDLTGKTISKQTLNYTSTDNNCNLNIGNLAAGMYFLKLTSADGNQQTIRVIKD